MVRFLWMNKNIFLLSFFSILFFLPLGHDLSRYGISRSLLWDDVGWLLGIWIFFFLVKYFVQSKFELRSNVLAITLGLTFLLFIHVGLNGIFLAHFSAWVRYLIFLWLLFAILILTRKFSPILSCFLLLGVLCLQAQWGIFQFVLQHDLGFQIAGEPRLTVATPGVAKFLTTDTKVIRAYGPYLHPNALGASLVAGSAVLTSIALSGFRRQKQLYGFKLFFYAIGFIFFIGILLSFSRAAYVSWLLVVALALIYRYRHFTSSLINNAFLYRRLALVFLAIIIVFIPFFVGRFTDTQDQAFRERGRGLTFALEAASELPMRSKLLGVGIGNYPTFLHSYLTRQGISYDEWEVAPVHNAFLLLVAEIGILGSCVLLALIVYGILRSQKMFLALGLFLPMLPLVLLDHYMLTQTAPLSLWVLAVIFSYTLLTTRKAS